MQAALGAAGKADGGRDVVPINDPSELHDVGTLAQIAWDVPAAMLGRCACAHVGPRLTRRCCGALQLFPILDDDVIATDWSSETLLDGNDAVMSVGTESLELALLAPPPTDGPLSLPKFIAAHAEALAAAAHAIQGTHVRNIGDAIAAAFGLVEQQLCGDPCPGNATRRAGAGSLQATARRRGRRARRSWGGGTARL